MVEHYEVVANEYYDRDRHPTCANFRDASRTLLETQLGERVPSGPALDVGCGDSLAAELLIKREHDLRDLVLVDSSPTMLKYSLRWRSHGASLVCADAEELPLRSDAIGLLLASLGDPFNTPAFWVEVRRVLRRDGTALFTTPSFEWASTYRRLAHYPERESEFVLQTGEEVTLSSVVLPEQEQVALLESVGLGVRALDRFRVDELPGRVSPKLLLEGVRDQPIVIAYEVVRTH